ncbi:MAG TPA: hypothetical protein VKA67_13295, partial [Verrucomicrobiae bacterium]|nr:hypothetical protein [Verrucomicrobiae bacterium]
LYGVAYGSGVFVTVCQEGYGWDGMNYGGALLTSDDGIHWTRRHSGTQYALGGVCYGDGHFIAVGDAGTILESQPIIHLVMPPGVPGGGNGVPLKLELSGPNGQSYSVQASTDLTNWNAVSSGVLTNGTGEAELPTDTNYSSRFFRAAVQ